MDQYILGVITDQIKILTESQLYEPKVNNIIFAYQKSKTELKKEFNVIFTLISMHFELDYVSINGKDYYNNSSEWYDPRTSDDIHCDGYRKCKLKKTKLPENSHIEYKVIKATDFDSFTSYSDFFKQKKYFKNCSQNKEIPYNNVYIVNPCGKNKDHRGSDHTSVELDFNKMYKVKGKTMLDYAEAYFRVKSHKFENNYELFTGVKKVKITNEGILVYLDFDHGS